MVREKTLGEKILDSLSEEERAKVLTSPPLSKETLDYLENLRRFEEASRRVNIRVGGEGCGSCKRAGELQKAYALPY